MTTNVNLPRLFLGVFVLWYFFIPNTYAQTPCTDWQSPSPTTGWFDFNNDFGGAPCDDGAGCPFFELDYELWASEAYGIDNVQAGGTYTFSACNSASGTGTGGQAWDLDFTVIAPSGAVDAFGLDAGSSCALTWTASESGAYLIAVNEANACGTSTNTDTDNGFAAVTCTNTPCPAPPDNDDCTNAEALSMGVAVAGTNVSATTNQAEVDSITGLGVLAVCQPPIGFSIENAVWYSFTVTVPGNHTVAFTGNSCAQSYAVYPAADISCTNVSNSTLNDPQAFCAALGAGGDSTITVFDARDYYLIVDGAGGLECAFNLEVFEGPYCEIPTEVNTHTTNSTAEISWLHDGISMDIEWGEAGFTQGTGTSISTNEMPYTLENLTAATTYEFYLQADCGAAGLSEWAGPFSFTTLPPTPLCGENFYDAGGLANDYFAASNETYTICPDNPTDAVTLTFSSSDIESAAGSGTNGTGCWDYLTIYDGVDANGVFLGDFCTSPSSVGTGLPLAGASFTAFNTSGCLTVVFNSDASVQGAGWEALVTCDLAILCPDPIAGVADNITENSADLTWTSDDDNFNIEWGETGFTQGNGTTEIAVSNPFNLSDLTAETTYDFYVQADCGADGTSNWVGPFSFTTQPPAATCSNGVFYDSGGLLNPYSSNASDTTIICPDIPGDVVTVTFKFVDIETSVGAGNQAGCWDFLSIYDGNTTNIPLQSTACGELNGDGGTPSDPASLLQQGDSFTSSDASGCLTFVFNSDNSVQGAGWEAAITCEPAFVCPPNLNLTSSTTPESITNANDGSIDLTVTGGTAPYDFVWSNGATTEDLTNLSTGTYCVTVTDANECTDTDCIDVASACSQNWNYDATVDYESGAGELDAEIDLTVTGGVAPYTYLWSNGATSQDLGGLAGLTTYTVTITDAAGCTVEYGVYVGIDCPQSLDITGVVMDMEMGLQNGAIDITVNGGTPPYEFEWSNGPETEDIDELFAGIFTVNVRDALGCFDTYSATVDAVCAPNLYLSAVVTDESELGAGNGAIDLTVGAGTPPFTYVWDNVEAPEDLDNLDAGVYCVFVLDEANCIGSACFTVGEGCPSNVISDIEITDETAAGDSDGAIDISVFGGNPLYNYEWDNGSTAADQSDLTAGTYCVTVTDGLGCVESTCVIIGNACPPNFGATAQIMHQSTVGIADGAIDMSLSDGVAPYEYYWSNGQATQDLIGLVPGEYCVRITDAIDCVHNVCFVVEEGCPPNLITSVSTTQVSISGENDGGLDLTCTNGTAPYSYIWSTGETTEDIDSLVVANYTVTVTDAEGCTDITEFNVLASSCPEELITEEVTGYGTIDITVGAGAPPFGFNWSSGDDTEDVADLEAGRYYLTVTDAMGCTDLAFYDIDGPVSIEDITTLNSLQLHPNPAQNMAYLSLDFSEMTDVRIDILNTIGQRIEAHSRENILTTQFDFSLENYAEGVYFIRIEANGQQITKRLVVVKD